MPSPLAHTAAGYLFWRKAPAELGRTRFALVFAALSLLPDLDALPGFLAGDLYHYHNNFSHSISAAAAAALLTGAAARLLRAPAPRAWALFGLLCYGTHVIMDFFTVGRGVMLFWPFSGERFASPVKVFYGLRWSAGLVSSHHVYTVATEMIFIAALFFLLRRPLRSRVVK